MIRVNDRFSFKRDSYGWTLIQFKDGVNQKTQEKITTEARTYYSTLAQLCGAVIDKSSGEVEVIEDILQKIDATKSELLEAIEKQGIKDRT